MILGEQSIKWRLTKVNDGQERINRELKNIKYSVKYYQ